MARQRRIQNPGLVRHVMARGNGRMRIFRDDTDYRRFVDCLREVVEECELECWNYCLMPNHYHATLRPTRANLSAAIRRLNGTYAQWWNRRHGRVGHVFQGRFKDQVVQCEGYLLALSRYVVLNPVRARLVGRPEDWPWSSYRSMIGLNEAPAFLAIAPTLCQFGEGDQGMLQTRFAEYVGSQEDPQILDDRIRSRERILGDRRFKASVWSATSHSSDEGDARTRSDPGLTPV